MEPSPEGWIPPGLDLSKAAAARMYDYYLGGAHNFGVDRDVARQVLELYPTASLMAQANRGFLHRAVRQLASRGVRQFIDIGSGIPTVESVHETAQRDAPDARVLYVDHDPVAVAHSELILAGNPTTRVLWADLRQPQDILGSAQLKDLIDLSEPVAVLMVAVLHFIADHERPQDAVRAFLDAVAPGSYLVLSHVLIQHRQPRSEQVLNLYQATADPLTYRTWDQIRELFDGWELIDPGLVWVPQWQPSAPDETETEAGTDPAASTFVGAVGRKPAPR